MDWTCVYLTDLDEPTTRSSTGEPIGYFMRRECAATDDKKPPGRYFRSRGPRLRSDHPLEDSAKPSRFKLRQPFAAMVAVGHTSGHRRNIWLLGRRGPPGSASSFFASTSRRSTYFRFKRRPCRRVGVPRGVGQWPSPHWVVRLFLSAAANANSIFRLTAVVVWPSYCSTFH
jgi:hypothetical protein